LNLFRDPAFEILKVLANCLFFKEREALCSDGLVLLLNEVIALAICVFGVSKDEGVKLFFIIDNGFLHGTLTLILTEVGPSRLNAGYRAFIDGFSVSYTKFKKHFSSDETSVEDFGLDPLEDLGSE
jgi:uncharacterized membrane protein